MNSSYPANANLYGTNAYRPSPNRPGRPNQPGNDDRFGGFLFPFVLGGITGGLLAPAFQPRPYYPYYPGYYPYYRYY